MKISVITSVFNRVGTIGDTIESVRIQDYPQVEHIVQDGGSDDGTLAILATRAAPNVHVESKRDRGIYDGINRGIARATGEVIGLMHSDDVFAHGGILSLVAAAFADPAVDGVYGDLLYVSAQDPARIIRYWRSGAYDVRRFRRGWMPPHPTLYLRRRVFDRMGLYDTSFRIAADYEAMLRYFVIGGHNLHYIPQVMVRMRVGGESNRSLARILQKSKEDYRALRRHKVGGLVTLAAKNLTKISQFIAKEETTT